MGLLDLVVAVACALPVLARAYALGTLHLWCAPSLVTPRLALCLFGISLNYVAHAGIWKYPEAFAKLCAKKPLSHLGRHPVAVFAAGELLFKVWQWGCVLALLGGSPAPLWRAAADAPNWTKVYGLALAGAGQVLNGAMYAAIGNDGVYYGFKLGRAVPWCHAFPFNVGLRHPQYVGVVLTLLGLLSVFQSQELAEAGMAMLIVGWSLMYVYMSLMEELGDNDKKKP
ncbi:hypothetical protein M885DRAFT_556994 [Pelagophyceae sp. CCMP2097]|nr:hypothetical protein M885DRAFT_556994 [Pelagophyceae sp. CCMP2097]|mmetsp:Transcript_19355/g.66343  ORF Transcript_19355/g.66343 Transcript_19355/m.66343 type:complete len:227 (+) Transcript_19355:756-1436(+)